jgi:hypothetical protein
MKTVLKDVKTGLLFRNMDEWTSNLDQAASFRDTLSALKFCQRNNLDGAAIVHLFNGGKVQRVVGFYRKSIRPQPVPSSSPALKVDSSEVSKPASAVPSVTAAPMQKPLFQEKTVS